MLARYFSQGLGIDLGTASTLIYERGSGIVLNEPSVVAVRPGGGEIVAVGDDAKQMLGKTPGQIMAIRPMKDGVIANFEITRTMLRHFMEKVATSKFSFFRSPSVVLCVPCGITDMEKRAVEDTARSAGARETFLMDEPIAAAIGAGLDISIPRGRLIVNVGGGTSEVAVISLNGIVEHRSLRVGGNYMDGAITDYIRKKYSVYIGETTAEYVKIQLGNTMEEQDQEQVEVKGRSLISGLPVSLTLTSGEIREALQDSVERIVLAVRQTLENTPPELVADIYEDGIVMTGGGSLLRGLDRRIFDETGVEVYRAPNPIQAVAEGAGVAIENLLSNQTLRYAVRAEA